MLLSHAHIDHSGLLPRLAAQGFAGPVYATPATGELLAVMLPDSAHLQEKEAEQRTRARRSIPWPRRRPAWRCCVRSTTASAFQPASRRALRVPRRGHILGSAIIEIFAGGRKLVFSGDLGQPGRPIVEDPAPIEEADVLLVESTYGDRNHKSLVQTLDEFAFALNDTLAQQARQRGDPVLRGRAHAGDPLLPRRTAPRRGASRRRTSTWIRRWRRAATRITLRHAKLPDLERVRFTESLEESMRINAVRAGAIIISASGMCEGGRIRHHLRYNLSRPECAIVFVGFQAAGTLGRRIVDGAKTRAHLPRSSIRCAPRSSPSTACPRTPTATRCSAGSASSAGRPRQTWVVHGEPLAADALKNAIVDGFGWRAEVAAAGQVVEL